MTRRPLQPRMSRLARTTHAQTPSAKRHSESPTVQLGAVRPRRTAVSPKSLVMPTDLGRDGDNSGYSYGRYISSIDTHERLNSSESAVGAMIAVVLITEAQATPPAGWQMLHMQTFTNFTYYVAVTDSNQSDVAEWSLDWAGVTGLGEWAYLVFSYFSYDPAQPQGLMWDAQIASFNGSSSGTWPVPTDTSWLYSIPTMIQENCQYDYDSWPGPNTYGANVWPIGWSDTNNWAWLAIPDDGAFSIEYYVTDAVDDSNKIWRPDFYFDSYTTPWYTGAPSSACVLLGLKPA